MRYRLPSLHQGVGTHLAFFLFILTFLLQLPNLSTAQSTADSTWSFPTVLLDSNNDDTLDYEGQTVKVGGIANSSFGQLQTTRLSSAIQNDEYGIPIFTKKMETPFKAGDSLVIEGELQTYNGLNEIYADSYEVFPKADRTLTPKPFSKVEDHPQRYIGMLVTGSGTITQKGTISNGIYLSVTTNDMLGFEPKIFVSNFHDSFSEFNFDVLNIGDKISVTGVLSEYVDDNNNHHYLINLRTPDELRYAGIPRYYFYIGAIIILFIFIGVGVWIVGLRKQVNSKTREIQQSLHEKEVLLREIHHRIKNNLSIISGLLGFQQDTTKVQSTQNALQDSQSRIQSMALIHDKLYQTHSLSEIQLDNYLEELVEAISSTFMSSNNNIKLAFDLEPVEIDVDKVVPCGLLVNELVVNAFKHAFNEDKPGTLTVALKNQTDKAKLTVADDGPGLPDDFELGDGDSLGSMLIETFAAQLEANIKIDRDHDGTAFIFTFSLN